ncbi:DMT family transporter [Blastococcus saxobsidens]|uniref:EamA-like transporter family protein n=1 Tax=Blastococcus saxobsidens TaxID=138336 RepID=A0A4Q7Y385_9ACTN|nr:DMT family transporter [Blastococcus saxobsidens]RZU30844.1 EamA-like transporter family protein [Blastococcus saxobsidens]
MGEALAVSSLFLFSANVLLVGAAGRRLPQDLGFLLGLLSNVGCGGVVVLGQYLVAGESMPPPEWDALGVFAVGGLLTSYLGRWFFFRSVRTIGPTRASALQITNPLFAALAAWVLLGQALPPSAVLAGTAVLAGLYLTSRPSGRPATDAAVPGQRSLPAVEMGLALLGAVAYGLGNVARGAGVRDWEVPVVGSLVGAAAGLLLHAVVSGQRGKVVAALRDADPVGRRLWLLSGVLTISAQTCLIAASLYIPVAVAVVISAALPIVVLPASVLFFRRTEMVGTGTAVGALLVLAGVVGLTLG